MSNFSNKQNPNWDAKLPTLIIFSIARILLFSESRCLLYLSTFFASPLISLSAAAAVAALPCHLCVTGVCSSPPPSDLSRLLLSDVCSLWPPCLAASPAAFSVTAFSLSGIYSTLATSVLYSSVCSSGLSSWAWVCFHIMLIIVGTLYCNFDTS